MRFRAGAAVSSLERIYLIIALSSGLAMAVLNPPFAGVPDEKSHYYKSWAVALGDVTCRIGNTIPRSAYDLANNYPKFARIPGVGDKVVFHKTIEKVFDSDDLADRAGNAFAVCGAPPLGYVPQAVALRLGSLLGWSVLAGFFLARILNLIVSVLLTFWAIRVIPYGKAVLLAVALLPMTIQQSASLGYDALHTASCFLFIAYVLKLASAPDEPLRRSEAALLLLLGLLVSTVKYGYIGLTLLVLLLPPGKFGGRRRWLFWLGYLAANALVFVLVYQYFQAHLAPGGGPGLPKVHAGKQLNRVVGAPLEFLSTLLNTLYVRFNFYFETFLFKPGWLNASLLPVWYVLMAAGMVIIVRNQDEEVPLTRGQRFIMLGVFLLNVLAVFFSMYLAWTPVGAPLIEGVQGRYLLCVFPLLVLFFYKAGFTFRHAYLRRHIRGITALFFVVMIGWMFLALYDIYYNKEPEVSLAVKLSRKLLGSR